MLLNFKISSTDPSSMTIDDVNSFNPKISHVMRYSAYVFTSLVSLMLVLVVACRNSDVRKSPWQIVRNTPGSNLSLIAGVASGERRLLGNSGRCWHRFESQQRRLHSCTLHVS